MSIFDKPACSTIRKHMLWRLASIALGLLVQPVHAARDSLVVGQTSEFSAGTYGFHASPISFQGRKLGYASANYKPQRFSANYWVYLSCVMAREDSEFDGECMRWKVLDTRTRQVAELKLPGFDSFWSVPAFAWPYVAYVETGKSLAQGQRDVYCVLFDYQNKSIVQRRKQVISEPSFATDFPHMFTPPAVTKGKGAMHFAFGFDDAGNHRIICELSVP